MKRAVVQQWGMRVPAKLTLATEKGLFVSGAATRITPESSYEQSIVLQIQIREWLAVGSYSASYKTVVGTAQGTYNLAEYAFSAGGDWIYTGRFTIDKLAV